MDVVNSCTTKQRFLCDNLRQTHYHIFRCCAVNVTTEYRHYTHCGWWWAICIQPASSYTFTYLLLLNIRTQLQSLDCELPEQESRPSAGFLENCPSPYCTQPTSPHAPITTTYIQQPPCTTTTTTTQCKLQYVHAVYAQVLLGRRPPAQVAEGNHHECR